MHQKLKQKYISIYKELLNIVIGGLRFNEILDFFVFTIHSTPTQSLTIYNAINDFHEKKSGAFDPLRIQLNDTTGIGRNSLSYKLLNDWATNNNLKNYKLIMLCPTKNFRNSQFPYCNDMDVMKYISFIYETYTEEKLIQEFDKDFFQNSLFIFDDFNSNPTTLVFLETLKKCNANIIVINSNFTKKEKQPDIDGLVQYEIKLKSPQIKLGDKTINSVECLKSAKRVIQFSFNQKLVKNSVIDYISNLKIQAKANFSSKTSIFELIGQEHQIPHKYPLVISYTDLVLSIFKEISGVEANISGKEIKEESELQTLKTVVDWYTAAVTILNDKKGIYTYNIGNQLISRNVKDNFISNLGSISSILLTIKENTKKIIENTKLKNIPEAELGKYVCDQVLKKLNTHYKISPLANTEQGHLSSLSSTILKEFSLEPTYNEIYEKISTIDSDVLASLIKSVLQGKSISTSNVENESFIYLLVFSLYVAETERNNLTFLPSLSLLDLCEHGPEKWIWSNIVAQRHNNQMSDGTEITLSSIVTGPIITCKNDFGGSHPMTHHGSYYQSLIPWNGRSLTWVEFKCCLIFSEWLSLTYRHKPFNLDSEIIIGSEINNRLTWRLQSFSSLPKDDFYFLADFSDTQTVFSSNLSKKRKIDNKTTPISQEIGVLFSDEIDKIDVLLNLNGLIRGNATKYGNNCLLHSYFQLIQKYFSEGDLSDFDEFCQDIRERINESNREMLMINDEAQGVQILSAIKHYIFNKTNKNVSFDLNFMVAIDDDIALVDNINVFQALFSGGQQQADVTIKINIIQVNFNHYEPVFELEDINGLSNANFSSDSVLMKNNTGMPVIVEDKVTLEQRVINNMERRDMSHPFQFTEYVRRASRYAIDKPLKTTAIVAVASSVVVGGAYAYKSKKGCTIL